jgi:hypothetical protein
MGLAWENVGLKMSDEGRSAGCYHWRGIGCSYGYRVVRGDGD